MQLRSMLRFTIRDVLWLTLVVGLAVGWWVDKERSAELLAEQEQKAQNATIKALGYATILAEMKRGPLVIDHSVDVTFPVSDVRDLRSSAPSQPFGHFPPE